MKLKPIAKPIRIRIKLGNSEYSSLDSVKSNFSLEELFPLFKDGRLERWLMQIGEVQLAKSTGNMSKQCGNGDIRDYIQFLSLFYDEVADSLSAYNSEGEWSLNDYLSTVSINTLKRIYSLTKNIIKVDWHKYLDNIQSKENIFSIFEDPQFHTVYDDIGWGKKMAGLVKTEDDYKSVFRVIDSEMRKHPEYEKIMMVFFNSTNEAGYKWASIYGSEDLDTILDYYSNELFVKNCEQDWPSIIRPHVTIDNIKSLFESKRFSDIFKDHWGDEFARLVTDEDKYKGIFTYLEKYSRNNPLRDKCKKCVSTFYSESSKKGYQWVSVFKDELSLDYILYIYQNECFRFPGIDWGTLFADFVKDWDNDSERVKKYISHDSEICNSFYHRCAENGFDEAKKMDPWYDLANSDDYEYIIKAINEWDYYGRNNKFSRNKYNYHSINLPLGKQILDFMQSLINLRNNKGWVENQVYNCEYYLKDEKEIMMIVNDNYFSSYYNITDSEEREIISTMKKRGVKLAEYALAQEFHCSWMQIVHYVIQEFKTKLENKRKQ